MNLRYLFLPLAAMTFASCKVGPDYKKPEVSVPGSIRGAEVGSGSFGDATWKNLFGDSVLQGLIAEALQNNRDLVAATYRIEEARAFAESARSEFFPTLDGSTSASRSRASQANGNSIPGVDPHRNSFDIGAALSYEIDLWGRVRRSNESARATLLSTEHARNTVRTTLVASVAAAYVELRSADTQLEISLRTLESRKSSFELVQSRTQQGVSSDLELNQGEVLLRQAEVAVPLAERLIALKENEISLLLGRNPGPVARGRSLESLQDRMHVTTGIPSAILERRPDILAAEQRLVSANADIGVAKAAYFPVLSLTARGGLASNDLDNLFDGAAKTWSFAPNLAGPIFNAGRTRAGVRVAQARQQQALADYEKSIQQAFREVADALIGYEKTGEIVSRQDALVAALKRVSDLASTRYEGGASSYLEVLDAQRELFNGELSLTDARRARLLSVIEAYRALGGGWQE